MKLDKENMSPNVRKAGIFMIVAAIIASGYLLVTTAIMFFSKL
jgi:hypothetical protein